MNSQVRFLKTIKINKEIKFESIMIIERKKETDQRKRDRKRHEKDPEGRKTGSVSESGSGRITEWVGLRAFAGT